MSPSGENIVSRKQRRKNLLTSPTNSAHKHSYLGSQITEPISACKVYFRSPPGEISINPNVSHCTQGGDNFFGCCFFFFLKLLEQNGEGNKGNVRPLENKLKWLGGKNKLVKENAAASNEPINFREKMIMAISEIGHV